MIVALAKKYHNLSPLCFFKSKIYNKNVQHDIAVSLTSQKTNIILRQKNNKLITTIIIILFTVIFDILT